MHAWLLRKKKGPIKQFSPVFGEYVTNEIIFVDATGKFYFFQYANETYLHVLHGKEIRMLGMGHPRFALASHTHSDPSAALCARPKKKERKKNRRRHFTCQLARKCMTCLNFAHVLDEFSS